MMCWLRSPRVREDAGYPPLVTPTSQIVGTQAVFNVILGERYKMVTKEFKGLVHGDYGKTPAPIKPEFTKKILGDEQPITCRFADTLAPEMDKLKRGSCQVGYSGRGRADLRNVPAGRTQVLREAQRKAAGRRCRPCGFCKQVSPCLNHNTRKGSCTI